MIQININKNEDTSSKYIIGGLAALLGGGALWYLWENSSIKARRETTARDMAIISDQFRKELFSYHLEFYNLARDYILMMEEMGRPIEQTPHMTTEKISLYLEKSSIAEEYAKKRIEIIKRVKRNLSLNQFLKKSDELIREHIQITQENGQIPADLDDFYRCFYFEAVFLDGQTISIGYIPATDIPERLNHRSCLKLFSEFLWGCVKELVDFFEENKNNMNYEEKKKNLQLLCKRQNRMENLKTDILNFMEIDENNELLKTLKEDVRFYVIKLAHETSQDFSHKYTINDVNAMNNSFTATKYFMVSSILKKQHSQFYFKQNMQGIKNLKVFFEKFELDCPEGIDLD